VETPGLCRYFDRCWNCHEDISPEDTHCPACLSHLTFEKPQTRATRPPQTTKDRFAAQNPAPAAEPLLKPTPPIQELRTALVQAETPTSSVALDAPARIGRGRQGQRIPRRGLGSCLRSRATNRAAGAGVSSHAQMGD
jgi:hypothetical protein